MYVDFDRNETMCEANFLPLRAPMVVVSFNGRRGFLKAYVIKTGERRATYVAYRVIRH